MRLFLPKESFSQELITIADRKIVHYVTRVMRKNSGDDFVALDNSGNEFSATISHIDRQSVQATINHSKKNTAEPKIFTTLYQALPKKMSLFEMVLQKCTEIGVSRFVPIITERTERHEINNTARLLEIMKEASEQCGRGKIPVLECPFLLSSAFKLDTGKAKFFADSSGEKIPLLLPRAPMEQTELTTFSLYIGPEGGFTEKEIEMAQKNTATIVSLGPRTMRTETAAILLSGIVHMAIE